MCMRTDHAVLRTSTPYKHSVRPLLLGWCPKERGIQCPCPTRPLPSVAVFFRTTHPSPTKAFPDIRGQQPLSPGLSDSSGIYCAGVLSIFLPIPYSPHIALRGPYSDTRVRVSVVSRPVRDTTPCPVFFLRCPGTGAGLYHTVLCPTYYSSCNGFGFASTACVGRGEPQEVTQTLKRAFASARVLVLVPLSFALT